MSVLRLLPRRHLPKPVSEPEPRRPIACRVRVRTQSGDTYCYHALVDHTCTAINAALDYFGQCSRVSVMPCELQPMDGRTGTNGSLS